MCCHNLQFDVSIINCGHIYHNSCLKLLIDVNKQLNHKQIKCCRCRRQVDSQLVADFLKYLLSTRIGNQLELCPSTHNIDVPNVNRSDFQLFGISKDGFVILMNEKGDTRDDLRVPDGEMGTKMREEYGKEDNTVIVTVMSAVGEEAIIACKNATS
ncbi:eukaryotic translation initiation factor 5A-like [Oppia nitens]|uniref:eukaryotic translation initiation factor 5A-like n=1 Tax=Oppia nitens TaxID=1686743 RepID=UPI0023D9E5B5|nr:eukaryotic translation initiation factor 5A-like [Oppia nitens]